MQKKLVTDEEFMLGIRARLEAAAREAAETERRMEEEAEAKARGYGAVVEFPPKLSEQELLRRQQIIDQSWRLTVEKRKELEIEMERSCHRGPLDSDANL